MQIGFRRRLVMKRKTTQPSEVLSMQIFAIVLRRKGVSAVYYHRHPG